MRRFLIATLAVSGAIGTAYSAVSASGFPPLLLAEMGRSMATGIYLYRHAPPARIGEVVVELHPPGFTQPYLMKRVVATAGSTFCWRADLGTHELDGRRMPPPHPLAGTVGLTPWQGCRAIKPGEVVGYGQSPDSFDSRYRGPVHEERLVGVYSLAMPIAWLGGGVDAPDGGAHETDLERAERTGSGSQSSFELGR